MSRPDPSQSYHPIRNDEHPDRGISLRLELAARFHAAIISNPHFCPIAASKALEHVDALLEAYNET